MINSIKDNLLDILLLVTSITLIALTTITFGSVCDIAYSDSPSLHYIRKDIDTYPKVPVRIYNFTMGYKTFKNKVKVYYNGSTIQQMYLNRNVTVDNKVKVAYTIKVDESKTIYRYTGNYLNYQISVYGSFGEVASLGNLARNEVINNGN